MSGKEVCILILGFICVACYIILNGGEDMYFYSVKVGDKESSYYVMEDSSRKIIEDVIETSVHNDGYLTKELVEVSLKDLKLDMDVLYCYDKEGGNKINCKDFYQNGKIPVVEKQKIIPKTLEITRNEVEIYNGEYREDLNTLIKEVGRYYFIVTYEEKIKRTVRTTKVLFSVKVVK